MDSDRVSFLSPAQSQMLGLFGRVVRDAWQETPYQVGSSLVPGQIPRDIDVRVMISEEDFRQRFPGTDIERRHVCEQWRAQMMVWSDWGRRLTGLWAKEALNRLSREIEQTQGIAVDYAELYAGATSTTRVREGKE